MFFNNSIFIFVKETLMVKNLSIALLIYGVSSLHGLDIRNDTNEMARLSDICSDQDQYHEEIVLQPGDTITRYDITEFALDINNKRGVITRFDRVGVLKITQTMIQKHSQSTKIIKVMHLNSVGDVVWVRTLE